MNRYSAEDDVVLVTAVHKTPASNPGAGGEHANRRMGGAREEASSTQHHTHIKTFQFSWSRVFVVVVVFGFFYQLQRSVRS